MGILARCCSLIDPLNLGRVDRSKHVDPVEQLIAHLLGPLFHGQGQVLHSYLDFAGKLLTFCFNPEVVFAMYVSELVLVTLIELPLVIESEFVGGANIGSEVTWVLFLSLDFNYNISQVVDFSQEFEIHKGKLRRGRDHTLLWSNHLHIRSTHWL